MKTGLIVLLCDYPTCCKECKFFHHFQGGMNDHPSYCDLIDSYDYSFEGDLKFPNCPILFLHD